METCDGAHPVLLDQPLAARAGQVAVLPGHLRLALLQQHRQLAPLHLHFEMEEVERGVRLNILGNDTTDSEQFRQFGNL